MMKTETLKKVGAIVLVTQNNLVCHHFSCH